jgi:two-component system response regulator DesR
VNGRPPIRILLAEDQAMVRSALISLIELEDDIAVVGEAGRGDEAVTLVTKLRPDVAVLDIDMPGLDGITACAQIHEIVPECACLVLTALGKPGTLQRALRAHARGFIVKHAPADQLIDAIRAVAAGQRIVDTTLAVAALEEERIPVTDRELEVVRLIAQGSSVKEIALRLYLSEGTVRNYTSNLMAKCGVRNRVELVRMATDRGWV